MPNYRVLGARSIIRRMDGPIVLVNIDDYDRAAEYVPYLFYDQEGLDEAVQAWRRYYDGHVVQDVDPAWFTDWMEERGFSFVPFRIVYA